MLSFSRNLQKILKVDRKENKINSIASRDSFHSIEDDGERDGNQATQDDMILSVVS